jgi:hypothetical protein
MGMMAALTTISFVNGGNPTEFGLPLALFLGASVIFTSIGAVRAFFVGVWANRRGIVIRRPLYSVAIPWGEVVEICDAPVAAAPGLAGVPAPAVVRTRPGKQDKTIVLVVLGSYGVTRKGRSLASDAIADLNRHLDAWRREANKAV